MTWFKVDDTLAFHRKTVEAGNAAMGLWVRAGSWSSQSLTDGFIPRAIARQLGTKSQITRLVNARLWIERSDGYQFHDWSERQPSKEDVESDRAANRKRQAEHRKRKREARDAAAESSQQSNGVTSHPRNGVTQPERNGVTNRPHARADPDPTRPDPNKYSPTSVPLRNASPANAHAATEFADGTPIPTEPPPSPITAGNLALVPDPPAVIEAAAHPAPVHPSKAVQTLIRYTLPPGMPREFQQATAVQAQRLLAQRDVQRDDVETALRELARRPGASPGLLPHLVADAARARAGGTPGRARPSTTDQRMAEGLALAAKYADEDDPEPTQAALDAARYLT